MQETAKASERRRVPRISVDLPATVTWSRKRRPWRARELSEFGVFLAPKRKEPAKEKGTKEQGTKEKGAKEEATIKEREEVLVDLGLEPKTSPLSLAGVVISATADGIAVRFKNLALEHHALLRNYVLARGIGIEKP